MNVSLKIAEFTALSLAQALEALAQGQLVAMPTETVYGLAGDATSDAAVAAIFAAKGRPSFNPLIAHVASAQQARAVANFPPVADALAAAFWPGPLTLVMRRAATCPVSLLACAGLDTIAVRIPAHPVARALLEAFGKPLVAPSANRSGRVSPTQAIHVAEELGNAVALVLDGGACAVGIESTVVDVTGPEPVILRHGSITREQVEAALGCAVPDASHGEAIKAPGMLKSHYAPSIPVRLNADKAGAGEALLAFGPYVPSGALETLNLSPSGNLQEAAANLFAMLRALDDPQHHAIAVMPIPHEGLGRAINDRLQRAAATFSV
jgi:L-threonylcarbamoyladenylate synthase